MTSTEIKEKLEGLLAEKADLLEKKAKLEANIETAEADLTTLRTQVESLFGTSDIAELRTLRDQLTTEAEALLTELNLVTDSDED